MKPSSGRVCSAKTLAIAALCGLTFTAFSSHALAAQNGATLPQGPAVRDGTPEINHSISQQNWSEALTQLDARIAANPRDAQAKFKRATVLAQLNRTDEAIAAFTELTQLYPELPEPYNNLAALDAKLGRYTEARSALETAIKVNPGYGLAYENLGDLYLRLANESYKRAQSLGQASSTTRQRLSSIQKMINPPQTSTRATAKPAAHETAPPAMIVPVQSPSSQFGGPTGSLALPPYVAPSR
ncbi:tetratricopeptide repeat protein [Paraburkholderia bonniea]|uniref:tetratricopeptide repeat protein n=1 Tax=Paraburkholderia bonniea TaxID=2152891 RepID=UPI001290C8A2|nr:tetratricopeptide repeat protein [Paraburkholderia bonniea]WJF91231.1 tetratricopeptide repeat protein [Paraburkholderia bonniea]WJF94546.1 tetratricopeptide repeat protein [Paraburkholderia bonniea]